MDIRVGVIGKVAEGEFAGQYIKVVDDAANTGGFLVLMSTDAAMKDGFDVWIESGEALRRYFAESSLSVDWME